MGFKTEINYILKSSDEKESQTLVESVPGQEFIIEKVGARFYIMDTPIMFADWQWNILGMCVITQSYIKVDREVGSKTQITARVLTRFVPAESSIISNAIRDGGRAYKQI